MDFMGQLATYARVAAHAKAEQTRKELAKEIANIAAKPMRKIVREDLASGGDNDLQCLARSAG